MSILTAVVLVHNKANIPHPPPSSLCKTAVQISLVCAWNILRSFKSTLWVQPPSWRFVDWNLQSRATRVHACNQTSLVHGCMDRAVCVWHKNNQNLHDAAGTPNHFSEVSAFIIGAKTNPFTKFFLLRDLKELKRIH